MLDSVGKIVQTIVVKGLYDDKIVAKPVYIATVQV